MDRRTFMAITGSLLATRPLASLAEVRDDTESIEHTELSEPWKTIDAVQNHLFPASKDSPGAKDIHALVYLQRMIKAPDITSGERELIKRGEGWLNDLCKQKFDRRFTGLSHDEREKILRQVERSSAGERWLSKLMTYIIEALLSDPVYGGNPDGIGWKWLQHKPGFPLPDESHRYYQIGFNATGKVVKRRTKA